MRGWSFLTNHARAILYIADHTDARLRDLAVAIDVTERTAYGIVVDLTEAGYVVKQRDGRRNSYQIQTHLPLPETIVPERTIGEVLDLLRESTAKRARARSASPGTDRRSTTRDRRRPGQDPASEPAQM